jgi:hypothetical protein
MVRKRLEKVACHSAGDMRAGPVQRDVRLSNIAQIAIWKNAKLHDKARTNHILFVAKTWFELQGPAHQF